ncbi:hypothetical protein PSRA_0708 [Pseudoscardovia radai]|uniref:Uncharacterized protein n=1 Tax=Pseudoscardovia radai TaxID=987066 RepID=A0A261EZ90_9BIFI|nr:hypothetical protein [Pseudoscardovia radai]OZG52158.1 hypothetical protein PSRA_0708 [Pseudoscardovia radai]
MNKPNDSSNDDSAEDAVPDQETTADTASDTTSAPGDASGTGNGSDASGTPAAVSDGRSGEFVETPVSAIAAAQRERRHGITPEEGEDWINQSVSVDDEDDDDEDENDEDFADTPATTAAAIDSTDPAQSHQFGHRHIRTMDDLRAAIDIMHCDEWDESDGPRLEAFWIDSGGERIDDALSNGKLNGMPFYDYPLIRSRIDDYVYCSTRRFRRASNNEPNFYNAGDFVNRLAVSTPTAGDPAVSEGGVSWGSSSHCMFRSILDETNLLLTEPTPGRTAPDCLVLCERESGLAMPVPTGMTLEWRIFPSDGMPGGTLDIRTYCLPRWGASNPAYTDMTRDVDQMTLCREAVATERFLVALLTSAASQAGGPPQAYDDYRQEIKRIREEHA